MRQHIVGITAIRGSFPRITSLNFTNMIDWFYLFLLTLYGNLKTKCYLLKKLLPKTIFDERFNSDNSELIRFIRVNIFQGNQNQWSTTLAQLLMSHTRMKVQKQRLSCVSVLWLHGWLWKKGNQLGISGSIESPLLIYQCWLEIVCLIALGKTIHSTTKDLRNTNAKTQRFDIEAVSKMDDCFTICQYKTEELKYLDIYPYF